MESRKVYVQVNVDFRTDGQMLPRALVWEDGRRYGIDKVKAMRPAHADRAGGCGDRYTIVVSGRERYLFYEHNADDSKPGRWFVEGRG